MCTRAPSTVRGFVSNVCGFIPRIHSRLLKYVVGTAILPICHHQRSAQVFCQEAIMWKHLIHPNIVPLLGVAITPFQLISNWMPGGDLPGYIDKNPNTDRLKLVGVPPVVITHAYPHTSYLTSQRASATSIPAM